MVVNFDEQPSETHVTLPAHAFDYLKLKEKNAQATDLLTAAKSRLALKRDAAVQVAVPALGAVVLKFSTK